MDIDPDEAIHEWFGLTYANYLVLHRSVLQSMPSSWQREFVTLLRELQEAAQDVPGINVGFRVNVVDPSNGRYVRDAVPHYSRGRTRIELRPTRAE